MLAGNPNICDVCRVFMSLKSINDLCCMIICFMFLRITFEFITGFYFLSRDCYKVEILQSKQEHEPPTVFSLWALFDLPDMKCAPLHNSHIYLLVFLSALLCLSLSCRRCQTHRVVWTKWGQDRTEQTRHNSNP